MYIEYTVYAVKRIKRAFGSLSFKYSQSCLSHLQLALSSYNQQCETYNPCHHWWNTCRFLPPLLMFTRYMSKQYSQTNIEGKKGQPYMCLYNTVDSLVFSRSVSRNFDHDCSLNFELKSVMKSVHNAWWPLYEILAGSFPLFWSSHKGPFSQQLNIYFLIKFRIIQDIGTNGLLTCTYAN